MTRLFNLPTFARITALGAVFLFLLSMCKFGSYCVFSTVEISVVTFAPKLVVVGLLFFFIKLITSSIKHVLKSKNGKEKHKLFNVLTFTRWGLWIFFALTTASIIFGDVGALLTSLGLIGFGVTFALQKPLLNFVAWMNLNFHKTYTIGDRVRIGNVRGDVVEIQMMHTIVKGLLEGSDSPSGKFLCIPNELTLSQPVENFTKDNNFVNDELKVAITFESDWRKAKSMLNNIVTDVTKRNLHKLKTNMHKRMSIIDDTIEKLTERISKAKTKEREEKIKGEITELQKEKQTLAESFEDIPQQFRPNIHVEMSDSAIVLLAQFVTPYDIVKQVKTSINSAFLDAVRREKSVNLAYPHMELIMSNGNGGQVDKSAFPGEYKTLANFLQIRNISVEEAQAKKEPA